MELFFKSFFYGTFVIFLFGMAKEFYWFRRKLNCERKFLKDYDKIFKE